MEQAPVISLMDRCQLSRLNFKLMKGITKARYYDIMQIREDRITDQLKNDLILTSLHQQIKRPSK